MNVDSIDFVGFNRDHCPRDALAADLVIQSLALLKRAGLGVRKAVDAPFGMEDDRAGHHRAGQATTAYLVNACDRHEPVAVQAVFDVPAC